MNPEIIKAYLYKVKPPINEEITKKIVNLIQDLAGFSIFDYKKVAGPRHVKASINNTLRRKQFNDLRAKSIETEFLLFLSAERQINKAIKKVGISTSTSEIGLIIWDETIKEQLLKKLDEILKEEETEYFCEEIDFSKDSGEQEDLEIEKTTLSNLK